jgi:gliding motility-associated-like protein
VKALRYICIYSIILILAGSYKLRAQCPDAIESNSTIVAVDETCDGEEDGSITINFVTSAGIYEPILGDLDPAGGYRYALWDASIANYVYDDIGIAPPTSPINPNITISFTAPNIIVFNNLPPNPGIVGFGYFIIAERQDGDNCSQIYVGDPLGTAIGGGEPLPTASLSGGGTVCANDPLPDVVINFTGSIPYDFTYEVSGTPVTVLGHNSDIYTISGAAAGVYTVTALTDGNGCNGVDLGTPVTVATDPIPTPTITGPNDLCFGETGIYTTESGAGESNYVWSILGGTIISGGSASDPTVEVRWDGLGPFSVSVNYDNSFGCDASVPTTYPVNINPLPVPTFTGQTDVCLGSTHTYTTESGSGENNYIWTVSGGTIVSGGGVADPTIEITWDGAAPYEISVAYTDVNGCTTVTPTVLPVNVNPLPLPSLSGPDVICTGTAGVYTTDSVSGETNFIWTVSGGSIINGGTITDPSVEIRWDGAAPHEVSINYTDVNGCSASSPTLLSITVNPIPVPTITGPASVCYGTTQTYSTESGSGENGYVWTVSGGTIVGGGTATDPTVDVLWDGAAPHEITVNYTDVNGCTAVSPTVLPINVIPLPIPSLDGPGIVCEASLVTYSTDSTAGQSNFVWNVTGGTIVSGGTITNPSVSVSWDGIGPFQVSISYTDVNGCVASPPTILPVTVNPLPVPGITGPNTVCFETTETYTTESGSGITNYSWSVNGGTVISGGTATDASIEILWDGTGPYDVRVNYEDSNGCTASTPTTETITVNTGPTSTTFTGDITICEGESADLTITISGGTQPYNAYISTDGGTTISDSISIPDSNPFTYSTGPLTASITFTIVSVTDLNGCALDPANLPGDVNVTVNPLGNIVFSMPNSSGNMGDQLLMPVTVQGFNDIISTSFSITWDETIIRYLAVENIAGISELDLTNFILTDSSTLTLQWTESSSTGQSIADGQTLFEIRYELIGPDCFASAISFGDNPVSISVIDVNACGANVNLNDGSINVGGSGVSSPPVTAFADSVNCLLTPIPELIANGVNILWYSDAALTNLVGTGNAFTPVLDNSVELDTTFYATQTIGTCTESLPDSSRIEYTDYPSTPPIPGQERYEICINDPAPTLVATGINIRWYSDPGLTNLVGTGNTYTPGPAELDTSVADTTYFYMTQSNVCGDGPYDSTSVHVKIQSYEPIINSPTTVCVNDPTPTFVAIGTNINWYSDAALTNLIATGNSFTPDSTQLDMTGSGTTYFYITQDDGCGESNAAQLVVNVIWCISDCSSVSAVVTTVAPGCGASDGQIQISASGGTGFFTYQLITPDSILLSNQTGQFNNLPEGMYVYEIVDDTAMCITPRDTVVLSDPLNITALADTASFVNSVCYDEPWGRAIINVTGGTDPYEYSINGSDWYTFNSGQYIDSLPPLGTYIVLVREDASSVCYEQVTVTISNEYPPIAFTYSTTDATCDDDDGSITIESITGGLDPYEISLDFGSYSTVDLNNLPVFNNLSAGLKNIRVRDVNNCVVEDPNILVDFPGYLSANIQIFPPTCTGGGKDGQVSIFIDSAINVHQPPYQYGFADENTPETAVTLQPLPANTSVSIDTLSNGFYYVLLTSGTACLSRTNITVSGGPTAISFELTDISGVPCKGENGTGSVTIDNVIGDSTQIYVLELISLPDSSVVFNTNLFQEDFSGGYTLDGNVTNQIKVGQYQIRISQNQSGCNLSSISQPFDITEPEYNLDFEITEIKSSWADIPSGTVSIRVIPSGGDPYETRIETISSFFPGQDIDRDWDEAFIEDGNYVYTHEELYSGIYEVSLRDDYGCIIYKEVTVGQDTALFIPNVFTPNNDSYNDYFDIRNLPGEGSGTVLVISNRWGKIIFKSDDYNSQNLWDGGDNPDGTYYYRLDIPNKGSYKGWVEIWRGTGR